MNNRQWKMQDGRRPREMPNRSQPQGVAAAEDRLRLIELDRQAIAEELKEAKKDLAIRDKQHKALAVYRKLAHASIDVSRKLGLYVDYPSGIQT
jgi:hypothetical protein